MYKQIYLLMIFCGVFCCAKSEAAKKDICQGEPVELDQNFISCCKGKPSFASESCIEALSENNTLTQECFVECMYKDFKIYDGNQMDMNGVKIFFEANVSDADIRKMFVESFDYCTKIDKKSMTDLFHFTDVSKDQPCDLYPAYMDLCVWYHTVAHCPEKYVDRADEQCIAKTQWVRQCLLK